MTKAIERKRWAVAQQLEKAAKHDPELAQLARQATALWSKADNELEARDFAKGKALDGGQTSWTVFVPLARERMVKAYVRTPHRAWQELFFSWGSHAAIGQRLAHSDPWENLRWVMEQAAAECAAAKMEAAA